MHCPALEATAVRASISRARPASGRRRSGSRKNSRQTSGTSRAITRASASPAIARRLCANRSCKSKLATRSTSPTQLNATRSSSIWSQTGLPRSPPTTRREFRQQADFAQPQPHRARRQQPRRLADDQRTSGYHPNDRVARTWDSLGDRFRPDRQCWFWYPAEQSSSRRITWRGRRCRSAALCCSASERPRHHQRKLVFPERVAVRADPFGHDHIGACIS